MYVVCMHVNMVCMSVRIVLKSYVHVTVVSMRV